ncbi:regulatory-associated protein of mTOR isoform X2 [Atheta coriaria]|uniref:regulatory-associated protein of mTOR isoform X2 n=1 Tax=Dalotia coriaria TaxID=877792 RepID=UPI0031F393D6
MVDRDYGDEAREAEEHGDESFAAVADRALRIIFAEERHVEAITGMKDMTEKWRMTERMKTVSVALVLCLNVGVDPPDIVKTQPCARLECWIDPLCLSPSKALETIGSNLQKQYERWQPRARYKQSLDPTSEEVKKLCTSLRRNAKEERVLFHYNGHGVPKPTDNGEIWVFNRTYTQYIPLSIYDLQTWMGAPSIYVYDCSNAGIIVHWFKQFADQHTREHEQERNPTSAPSFQNCIQLAACDVGQVLPMNPDLPADLFTACLTTPIKVALRWFVMQSTSKLVPKVTMDLIDKIPGQIADRRTMIGELNFIFTAITDTIAWNTLPRERFQKLFRQDLLVASLFRNFLLAERILRSCDCTPVSSPALPPTYQHPMWQAWDLALDLSLGQLPGILENGNKFVHLPFFEEQLTAFQVWLDLGSEERNPPEQLPIVLQVLLTQVHRMRALELLGRFLDLGPWAVNLALSVGIFPYVLKLLQSCAKELRPLLVFIWAKILAVDHTCQADLVRDKGHTYFLQVLQDSSISSDDRTLAAFVLACIVKNFKDGQEAASKGALVSICLEQLDDNSSKLRQWVAICLGRLWDNFDKARWTGVRDSAHEKLYTLLQDPCPEVRASAVFALGTFINSVQTMTEHSKVIDHSVVMTLVNNVGNDMSPLVRKELVVAIQWFILAFERSFLSVAAHEASKDDSNTPPHSGVDLPRTGSRLFGEWSHRDDRIKRVNSSSSISTIAYPIIFNHLSPMMPSHGYGSLGALSGTVYLKVWNALATLDNDPFPEVSVMAGVVITHIRSQLKKDSGDVRLSSSISLPPSPNRASFLSESPPSNDSPRLKLQKKGQCLTINEEAKPRAPLVCTQFIEWACKGFAQPVKKTKNGDVESEDYYMREWRYTRNAERRSEAKEEQVRASMSRLESQVFNTRTQVPPTIVQFHPYEHQIVVVGKETFGVWDWSTGAKLYQSRKAVFSKMSQITSMDWVNPQDVALFMTGSDDGTVSIYKPSNNNLKLVTAWQAHSDLSLGNKLNNPEVSSGLRLTWEQYTQSVITTGDTRVLRFWDAERELKLFDLPTGADCSVTSLDSTYSCVGHEQEPYMPPYQGCDGLVMNSIDAQSTRPTHRGLVVAGCADGSIRVFDRRCSPADSRIKTWIDHSSPVIGVQLRGNSVVSGGSAGDIKIYDLRKNSAVCPISSAPTPMIAMAVHRKADTIACGYANQTIGIYNLLGQPLNVIRFYEGFMGYRIGQVACLGYHPYKVALATGMNDCSISVYCLDNRR